MLNQPRSHCRCETCGLHTGDLSATVRVCGKCTVLPRWWLARNAQAGPRKPKPQQRKRARAKPPKYSDPTVAIVPLDVGKGAIGKSTRTRKRGCSTGVATTHRSPQRNKRRRESKSPSGASARGKRFPYPVGTRVASDFKHHGVFEGTIVKLYSDTPSLCYVEYTDGDGQDLDAEEIEHAILLYEREYGSGST